MKISKALSKYFSAYQMAEEENCFSRLDGHVLRYYKYSLKGSRVEVCELGTDSWTLADTYTKYFILMNSLALIPACLLMQELKTDFQEMDQHRSLLDLIISDIALLE